MLFRFSCFPVYSNRIESLCLMRTPEKFSFAIFSESILNEFTFLVHCIVTKFRHNSVVYLVICTYSIIIPQPPKHFPENPIKLNLRNESCSQRTTNNKSFNWYWCVIIWLSEAIVTRIQLFGNTNSAKDRQIPNVANRTKYAHTQYTGHSTQQHGNVFKRHNIQVAVEKRKTTTTTKAKTIS